MKNCKKFEENISEMVFGTIPFEQQEALHNHMSECDGCLEFYMSLFETMADTDGEALAVGLTVEQKEEIYALARQIDAQNAKNSEQQSQKSEEPEQPEKSEQSKEPVKFRWQLPLSIAAAVAVSGIIIIPQLSRSFISAEKTSQDNTVYDAMIYREIAAEEESETEETAGKDSFKGSSEDKAFEGKKAERSFKKGYLTEKDAKFSLDTPDAVAKNETDSWSGNKFKSGREVNKAKELSNKGDKDKPSLTEPAEGGLSSYQYDRAVKLNNAKPGSRIDGNYTVTFGDEGSENQKPDDYFVFEDSHTDTSDDFEQDQGGAEKVSGTHAPRGRKQNDVVDYDIQVPDVQVSDPQSNYFYANTEKNDQPEKESKKRAEIERDKEVAKTPVIGNAVNGAKRQVQETNKALSQSGEEVLDDEKVIAELKDVTISPSTVDNVSIAEEEISQAGPEDLKKAEEVLKQNLEIEAEHLSMQAESRFKDGDTSVALTMWSVAVDKLEKVENSPRVVAKIREIKDKISEVKASDEQGTSRRPMITVNSMPQSTFSIDVDTASYQIFKSTVSKGGRPDPLSIRAEEFINSFNYGYEAPKERSFEVNTEVTASPFHRGAEIIKVGVQGSRPGGDHRSASHFCFIVDTSGSMAAEGRLPLVKKVLPMIIKQMSPGDKVSLFSGGLQPRLIIDHMDVSRLEEMINSIDSLNAVGATNLESSLVQSYNYVLGKVKKGLYSRVILLSDGVANVGEDDANKILTRLETARKKGVGITVVGMGENEYNDNFLETLANKGDGNYLFIDGGKEAQKAFEENFAATFHTIAYNVKIQVEFDPNQVSKYRLLGYENRRLKNKDFRNDKVDAGEVGSGQSVTAIYEIEPAETRREGVPICEVRLRYRDARDNKMKEFATPVKAVKTTAAFEKASKATRLAFLTGLFAEVMRDGGTHEGVTVNDILKHMRPLASEYGDSDVRELLQIMEKCK